MFIPRCCGDVQSLNVEVGLIYFFEDRFCQSTKYPEFHVVRVFNELKRKVIFQNIENGQSVE